MIRREWVAGATGDKAPARSAADRSRRGRGSPDRGKTPGESVQRPRPCASRSSRAGPIPSRAIAPVSVSSGSSAPMARRASRRPPNGPSRSAPGPIAPSNPSSTTSSIGGPRPSAPRRAPRSAIPTSVSMAPRFSSKVAPQNSPVWRVWAISRVGDRRLRFLAAGRGVSGSAETGWRWWRAA